MKALANKLPEWFWIDWKDNRLVHNGKWRGVCCWSISGTSYQGFYGK